MPGVPNETAETAITKDGDDDEEEDGAERESKRRRWAESGLLILILVPAFAVENYRYFESNKD